jgi:hypothetical protein
MAKVKIKHENGKDEWVTEHKGNNEEDEAEFVAAYINNNPMQETGMDAGGGKKKRIKCDKKKMQCDFDNHPGFGVREGGSSISKKLWCLPQRDAQGRIIGYTCYGDGPYSCG